MRYINVDAEDCNGSGYRMTIEAPEDMVEAVCKTLVNRTCLVVDAWGYGEYSDMYDYRMPVLREAILSGTTADMGFAGIFYMLDVDVTNKPKWDTFDIQQGLHEWDEVILQGCTYDPDTDPYDLNDIVPELGTEKYEFIPE